MPTKNRKLKLVVCVFFLLSIAVACTVEEDTFEARQTWSERGFAQYTFIYQETGFAYHPYGDVEITVINGVVASAVPAGGGDALDSQALTHLPCIEDLFDRIDQEYSNGSSVQVTFNSTLGYPERAYFSSGEEGDGFIVSDLMEFVTPQ